MSRQLDVPRVVTPEKKRAFIMTLAETGSVTKASQTIGSNRMAVYREYERDKHFASAWDEAKRVAALALEDEATRRAMGWQEPVYGTNKETGEETVVRTIEKYSDTLLIFLLKGQMPDKYGDRTKHEHAGNIVINVITGVPPIDAPFTEIPHNPAEGLC